MDINKASIGAVLEGIIASSDAELDRMDQAALEGFWHFRWNENASLEWNLYKFHDMLKLYAGFCRRWEERKNGTSCVVERVRDRYLIPKIRELAARLQGARAEPSEAWLPIETAPKDGSEVFFLVPDDKPQQVVCRWANEWGEHACWRYADDNLCEIAPEGPVSATHWRPIFALPSALAQ